MPETKKPALVLKDGSTVIGMGFMLDENHTAIYICRDTKGEIVIVKRSALEYIR